jgi:hypothetical protein
MGTVLLARIKLVAPTQTLHGEGEYRTAVSVTRYTVVTPTGERRKGKGKNKPLEKARM